MCDVWLWQCIQADCPTSCLSVLIEAGARVDEADRQGLTPLHVAAERGHSGAAALLQQHGAHTEALEKVENEMCSSGVLCGEGQCVHSEWLHCPPHGSHEGTQGHSLTAHWSWSRCK